VGYLIDVKRPFFAKLAKWGLRAMTIAMGVGLGGCATTHWEPDIEQVIPVERMIEESSSELQKIPLIAGDVLVAGYSNNYQFSQSIKTGDSFQFVMASGGHFEYFQSSPSMRIEKLDDVYKVPGYKNFCGRGEFPVLPNYMFRKFSESKVAGRLAASCIVSIRGSATLAKVEDTLRLTLTDFSEFNATDNPWRPVLVSSLAKLQSRTVEIAHHARHKKIPWVANDDLQAVLDRVQAPTHLCGSHDQKRKVTLASIEQIVVSYGGAPVISRFAMDCRSAPGVAQFAKLSIIAECGNGFVRCSPIKSTKYASDLQLTGDATVRIFQTYECNRNSNTTPGHPCNSLEE